MEVLGEKIALDNAENGTVRLVTDDIALEVWNLTKVLDTNSTRADDYSLGLRLTAVDGEPSSSFSDENLHQITDTDKSDNSKTDISIQIPASVLQKTGKGIMRYYIKIIRSCQIVYVEFWLELQVVSARGLLNEISDISGV